MLVFNVVSGIGRGNAQKPPSLRLRNFKEQSLNLKLIGIVINCVEITIN